MVRNLDKSKKRGRPSSESVGNNPFSLHLAAILATREITRAALARAAGLGGSAINSMLTTGNPTIQTVWALEDALNIPRGSLCIPHDSSLALVKTQQEDNLQGLRLPPVIEIPGPKGKDFVYDGVEMPVRGLAAADDSGGTRVPNTDDIDEPIQLPSGLTGVPVIGESMSPVVLGGQYVVIDSEREGFEVNDGIYVVSILEPNFDDDYPEPIVGTFVKRCERHENLYYLKSVNTFSPFSAHVDHCRVWPVLGTWFADKGKPPEGF